MMMTKRVPYVLHHEEDSPKIIVSNLAMSLGGESIRPI